MSSNKSLLRTHFLSKVVGVAIHINGSCFCNAMMQVLDQMGQLKQNTNTSTNTAIKEIAQNDMNSYYQSKLG